MSRSEIGPYRLLRRLRAGGGGTVYAARDRRLDRRVAIKLLRVPRRREQRDSVLAEAYALARLNNRSIVQIYDVVESRAHIALVMEYVPGTDLAAVLERVAPDLPTALRVGVEICSALTACHQSNIVHRDLKPGNVLVDPHGHIKLTDFGIAQVLPEVKLREATLDNVVSGSVQAMSPEHASGAVVDERSDLFCLGLILYRLIAGEHPFASAANELVLLQQVQHSPHISLREKRPELPQPLSDLVDALLEKDPRLRPPTALVVRQQLLRTARSQSFRRGNLLEYLEPEAAREHAAEVERVKVPGDLARRARSRLLAPEDWGAWGLTLEASTRELLIKFGSVVGLLLLLNGVIWLFQSSAHKVNLNPPLILGVEPTEAGSRSAALALMLEQAVRDYGGLEISADGAADQLSLQVNCNQYLCGLLLRRAVIGDARSEYRTLLPDAPALAWQSEIDDGLARLFAPR